MIEFFLNGKPQRIEVSPHESVLELVRRLHLAGTKEGCGEGDCGACTVVIGEKTTQGVSYRAVTSCLMLAPQLDGKHLLTIEGLAQGETLHPIQQAVLDEHATQCGFCTPGVVMSLLGLFLSHEHPNEDALRQALEGNLCRCTGYVSIKNAADYLREANLTKRLAGKIRPAFLDEIEPKLSNRSVSVEKDGKSFHAPRTFDELNSLIEKIPNYRLLNGGSDVVVAMKKHHVPMEHLIDLSRLEGMKEISIEPDQIRIGGGATLAQIKEATREALPALSEALGSMASHQVRTLATLAGNLGNASPIADTAPLLLAADATLVLQGQSTREVPLSEFYEGYKQTKLQPGEWIREIQIPRTGFLHFEKVSKRRAVDIATVNGAIALSLEGKKVKEARVAFGGVAATPVLAPRAAQALIGKELTVEAAQEAARVALEDLAPLSDVRGSKEYRRQLIEGILIKHVLAALSLEG